ncbi:MAG TPA: nucleotidyltransferase family protein [Nitrososphaerales archaeon]|nr:nucleotidyltransferase family protein [Nitrososphaerales archaeon]
MELKVCCVILAAGMSIRFGSQKQLFKIDGTKSLAQIALDTANDSKADYVILVVGSGASDILSSLDLGRADFVYNMDYNSGLSSSIKSGIANMPIDANAALLMVADQPFLKARLLDRMMDAYNESGKKIVALSYDNEIRNPILFDRVFFSEIEKIEGDRGARSIVQKHIFEADLINIEDKQAFVDIDSRDALQQ